MSARRETAPPISWHGLRGAAARLAPAWPVATLVALYVSFLGAQLVSAHGDPAIFVQFGRLHLASTQPPAGAPIVPRLGYDGQMYWLAAHDPLLRHASTITRLYGVGPYPLQRVAYPALAWLLAAGDPARLAWSLLIVNLAAVAAATTAVARFARRRGLDPAWALAVGASPGLLICCSRDLSDVLATTAMIGGLIAFRGRRYWLAGGLLALSALSREPLLLATLGVGAELAWCGVHRLRDRERAQAWRLLRDGAPAVLVPAVAFIGWRQYALSRAIAAPLAHGGHATALPDHPTLPPFRGLLLAGRNAVDHFSPASVFVAAMVVMTLIAILLAVWVLLRRGVSASAVTAALYALLVLPVTDFTDNLELARYTLPLFCALLLVGIERRSKPALVVPAAAAGCVLLLPLLGL